MGFVMKKVEVYGSSDDLIVVEGSGLTDEFGSYNQKKYLHFSDGTVLEVEYAPDDDPKYLWRIRPFKTGDTKITTVPGTYHEEEPGSKCDRVILEGDFRWVRCYESPDGPTRDEMIDRLCDFEWSDMEYDTIRAAFELSFGD